MADFDYYRAILAAIHTLAGAVWLGAMAYSFFLLHPKARRFFPKATDFEFFIATVSDGARWKVLAGLAVIAATGIALTALRWTHDKPSQWHWFLGIKCGFFLAALGLFCYTSWRLWPARVLALEEEIPRFQRTFRRVAIVLMGIAAASMTLGVWMHMG